MITEEILRSICPATKRATIAQYVPLLNQFMAGYGISTPLRVRHFIAQLAHESGSFQYVREIASGESYDTGNLAKRLGNTPEKDGDGAKFKGRGLIQITGRANYEKCSLALFGDRRLLDNPTLLELPENAVKSAAWFWQSRGLSTLADQDDIKAITKKINGGYNGLDDRMARYSIAKKVII